MNVPAFITRTEADKVIDRATSTIAALREHAAKVPHDAPRALKIARGIEANLENDLPYIRNLSLPWESATGWYLNDYGHAIKAMLGRGDK